MRVPSPSCGLRPRYARPRPRPQENLIIFYVFEGSLGRPFKNDRLPAATILIIYYVFEGVLCENLVIYYVFEGGPCENTIIYHVF